jgi:hypothetical protein
MTDRETPDSALELDKLSKELELLSRQMATANILFKVAMHENKAASNRRVARSDYYGTVTSQPVQWDIGDDAVLNSNRALSRGHSAGLCVFYYCRTYYKAVRVGGEESGGHVL